MCHTESYMDGDDCCSRILLMVEYTDYDPIIFTENNSEINIEINSFPLGVDAVASLSVGKVANQEELMKSNGMDCRQNQEQSEELADKGNENHERVQVESREGKEKIKVEKEGEIKESEIPHSTPLLLLVVFHFL